MGETSKTISSNKLERLMQYQSVTQLPGFSSGQPRPLDQQVLRTDMCLEVFFWGKKSAIYFFLVQDLQSSLVLTLPTVLKIQLVHFCKTVFFFCKDFWKIFIVKK